jgi:sugar lactone lactonase YvrE
VTVTAAAVAALLLVGHTEGAAVRSNKAVDVVDAETFVTQLTGGFAGFTPCAVQPAGANDCAGPNGVTTSANCLFVTDAPSRVVSFDKATLTFVNDVQTDPTDPTRADELAVDPRDSLILAINNASKPPFGTLIQFDVTTCTLTQPDPATNRIIFDAAHGVDATNGAEQPVWDPGTQKFYLSIPEISGDGGTNLHGAVLRIAPTGEVEAQYGVDFCGPAGLAVGPNEQLLVGCNTVFDTDPPQ